MQIDLIAQTGTKDEFYNQFREGDEKIYFDGRTLIFFAAANTDLETRYEICNYLLDKNIDATCLNKENQGILHVILAHMLQDIPKLTSLCKRMIEHGADINVLDKRKTVAFKCILAMKYSDAELAPLYALWFTQPYIELTIRDQWGLTPIDFAKRFPYRKDIVKRMVTYVQKNHN